MATSRLDDLRMVDPVLSTVAQGYSNLAMVGEHLFPSVLVNKIKGKYPFFGAEAFIVRDTERAIRANSNRIPPSDVTMEEFETQENDIEMGIDYIEEEESPDSYKYEHRVTKQLMDIILLGKEKDAADLAQNTANYNASNVETITSGTAFNDYTNDTNPITVIKDAMSTVRGKITRFPNTMIIGASTYHIILEHPDVIEKIKYSGVSKVNTQILSEILDIPNIFVGMSVYSDDGETFSDVWGDNIILAYVDRNEKVSRSEFNPSFGYTFQREGKPEVDTYYENGGKMKVIRCTDNYDVKLTSPDAGFIIYNTIH